MKPRIGIILIVVFMLLLPVRSIAQSDWEFYFFGFNLNKIVDGDYSEMAKGAAASLIVHELGHILYLESQGKDWKLETSGSGIRIWSNDYFTDNQYVKSGRAGFALQTLGSALLMTFKEDSDFTVGWVGMNALQFGTAPLRGNNELNR